jgi:cyclophilin family peptidyl-prolyl cis-trans isomerase
MVQGGGLDKDLNARPTADPIKNESSNGLKNDRGTIAMARTNEPDTATSQFFINHANNEALNYRTDEKPGYCVFGQVIEGMDVVDRIASVPTTSRGMHKNVPEEPVEVNSVKVRPPPKKKK